MERVKKVIKNWQLVMIFICLIIFLLIVEDVFDNDIMKADAIGYKLVSNYLISDFATPIAKFITNFGGTICLVAISIILFIIIKNKKIGLAIFANLGIAGLLNFTLKNILQRPRPEEYRIIDVDGYSFPSGHSMVSMAFYGFLIYLIHKNIKNKYLKLGLNIFLCFLIVSIGISRIYLGVHYTSDVLAGFLVSISYLIIYIKIISKYINEKND